MQAWDSEVVMHLSQFGGAFANAAARIAAGVKAAFEEKGIERFDSEDVNIRALDFCESKELERAAKKFGVERVELNIEPVFTVQEEMPFYLGDRMAGLKPGDPQVGTTWSECGVIMIAHHSWGQWAHRGTLPDWVGNGLPKPEVVAVIGTFNKAMDWAKMVEFFGYNTKLELYAGAWVRGAYLRARPDYDGKGEIFFPDEKESLWADPFEKRGKPEENLHYPSLWHDGGKVGIGGFTWIKNKVAAGRRVVCIRRIHPLTPATPPAGGEVFGGYCSGCGNSVNACTC